MKLSVQHMHRIAKEVKFLVDKTSQVNVANLAKVSNATISKIYNDKWGDISSEMFSTIKVNLHINFDWRHAEIENFQIITSLLNDVQNNSISICISEQAGRGKTHAYREYARKNNNVILLECKNSWNRKSYVTHLLQASGITPAGTTDKMIVKFVDKMKQTYKPIVILDQVDKLKDSSLDLYMDFYNDLDGECGFVLSGVKALEKKILNGVSRDRIGYAELHSRICRKFIGLEPITQSDVKNICHANDIIDPPTIRYIYANSEGDLRRVRRDVVIQQQLNVERASHIDVDFEVIKPPSDNKNENPAKFKKLKQSIEA